MAIEWDRLIVTEESVSAFADQCVRLSLSDYDFARINADSYEEFQVKSSSALLSELNACVANQISTAALTTHFAAAELAAKYEQQIEAARHIAEMSAVDILPNLQSWYASLPEPAGYAVIDGLQRSSSHAGVEAWAEIHASARDRSALVAELQDLLGRWDNDLPEPSPDVAGFVRAISRLVKRRVRVRLRFRFSLPPQVATQVHDLIHGHSLNTGVSPPDGVNSATPSHFKRTDTNDHLRRSASRATQLDTHLPRSAPRSTGRRFSDYPPFAGEPHVGRRSRLHPSRRIAGRTLHRTRSRQVGPFVLLDERPRCQCSSLAEGIAGLTHA